MTKAIRVMSYAVNGQGLGHLTRLLAVNRWIRRLARIAGIPVEQVFLTSSEADDLVFRERFASFKVPSKTAAREAGFDPTAYAALAKQWTWTAVSTLRPDLFVVDTFPRGAFGELLGVLELCRTRAFIHRSVDDAFADTPDFRAMLPLYDLVLVPDEPAGMRVAAGSGGASGGAGGASAVSGVPGIEGRVRVVPPIVGVERADLLPRDDARRLLGAKGDELVVLATTGGGGNDRGSRALFTLAQQLAGDTRVRVVIGAGPLERNDDVLGFARVGDAAVDDTIRERVTVWRASEIARCFAGVDVAVAAAGYNTFHELMQAGVPTLFVPQTRLVDDQLGRCLAAAERGAAVVLDAQTSLDALTLAMHAALDRLRDPAVRASMAEKARALVVENGARTAAVALLSLVAPAELVQKALAVVDDDLLRLDRKPGQLERQLKLARQLDGAGGVPSTDAMRAGRAILDDVDALAAPLAAGRTAEAWLARAKKGTVDERAGSTHAVLRVLDRPTGGRLSGGGPASGFAGAGEGLATAPGEDRGDWTAATMLVRALVVEHELAALDLVDALSSLLEAADARGFDLYRCVAFLAAHDDDMVAGNVPPTNRARIADAIARMRSFGGTAP